MLKLFTRNLNNENRNIADNAYRVILSRMKREIATTVVLHKKRKRVAKSSDIIVRLLKAVNNTNDSELEEFVRKNTTYLRNRARTLGLTGIQSKGEVFKDLFVNNEYAMFLYIEEIESFSSLHDWKEDWKNVCPVRVHSTTCSDLSMNLPTEYENEYEVTSLYSLNIPMLLVQYKEYINHISKYGLSLNVAMFVNEFIYANMIPQLYDHALVNRAISTVTGEDVEDYMPNYPGMPYDFTYDYDKIARKELNNQKGAYTFSRLLDSFITTTDHTSTLYRLPDLYINPTIMSAYHMGTSTMVRRLVTMASKKTLKLEKVLLKEHLLFIKAITSNPNISKKYPRSLKMKIDKDVLETLNTIKG